MMTFLAFIGVIALLFFSKFIYDTFLTNNTENDWKEFKEINPEQAARIENNEGLNFNSSPKTNISDREKSIEHMAMNIGCPVEDVEKMYIADIVKNGANSSNYSGIIVTLKEKKYLESRLLNIDPDDTPAAIMEQWTLNHFGSSSVHVSEDGTDVQQAAKSLSEQGDIKFSMGLFEDAIELFTKALLLDPQPIYFHNRGDAYYENKDFSKAKKDYEETIRQEPENNHRNIYSKLAGIYLDEKEFERALQHYNRAIELSPDRKKTLYNRAVAYLNLDNNERAIEDLELLIQAVPNDVQSYIFLATIYLLQGQTPKARQCIDDIRLREASSLEFSFTEREFAQLSAIRTKCLESELKR